MICPMFESQTKLTDNVKHHSSNSILFDIIIIIITLIKSTKMIQNQGPPTLVL